MPFSDGCAFFVSGFSIKCSIIVTFNTQCILICLAVSLAFGESEVSVTLIISFIISSLFSFSVHCFLKWKQIEMITYDYPNLVFDIVHYNMFFSNICYNYTFKTNCRYVPKRSFPSTVWILTHFAYSIHRRLISMETKE